jgi:enoyl-CoA hydratase/carnithine racemase
MEGTAQRLFPLRLRHMTQSARRCDASAPRRATEMPSELRTERRDTTLVLTMSDPATRNTLSEQLFAAGVEALDVAESDPDVRCLVLQGDGGHFCAGGHVAGLRERRAADPSVQMQMVEHFHQFIEALRTCPKPVIAAVEGAAAGGGFSLALACDLIVAADDARFIMSHARLGLSPDGGGSWQLAQMLPRQLALQLIWLAEPVTARQLYAHGVVNWIADRGKALAEACAVAERLSQMAPNALASAKELVAQGACNALAQHLPLERNHLVENLFHPNGAEGLQAFIDKRPPRFR